MPRALLLLAALLLALPPAARAVDLMIDTGGDFFVAGDELHAAVGAVSQSGTVTADVYLALDLPGGSRLFITSGANGTAFPSPAPLPLFRSITIPAGTDTGLVEVFDYLFTGYEPEGTYEWTLALTAAGTYNILALVTDSFIVGESSPDIPFSGEWTGTWENDTFGTSGDVFISISDDDIGEIAITVDFNGIVFGMGDPEPFTLTVASDPETGLTVSGGSSQFGTVDASVSEDGSFSGTVEALVSPVIEGIDFSGAISEVAIYIDYTVYFTDGTTAEGIITASRP